MRAPGYGSHQEQAATATCSFTWDAFVNHSAVGLKPVNGPTNHTASYDNDLKPCQCPQVSSIMLIVQF